MDDIVELIDLLSGVAPSRDSNGATTWYVTASWVPYHKTLRDPMVDGLQPCQGTTLSTIGKYDSDGMRFFIGLVRLSFFSIAVILGV